MNTMSQLQKMTFSSQLNHVLSSLKRTSIVKIKRNRIADSGAFYLHNRNLRHWSKKLNIKSYLVACHICNVEFKWSCPSPKEKQVQEKLKLLFYKEVLKKEEIFNEEEFKRIRICPSCQRGIQEMSSLRRKVEALEDKIYAIATLMRRGIKQDNCLQSSLLDCPEDVEMTKVELLDDEEITYDVFPIIYPDTGQMCSGNSQISTKLDNVIEVVAAPLNNLIPVEDGDRIPVVDNISGGDKPKSAPKLKVCPQCTKSVKSLSHHIKAVHGSNEFKCSVCSYTSRLKYNLTVHMENHKSKEEKRKCSTCGESFLFIKDRVAHEDNVHRKKEKL